MKHVKDLYIEHYQAPPYEDVLADFLKKVEKAVISSIQKLRTSRDIRLTEAEVLYFSQLAKEIKKLGMRIKKSGETHRGVDVYTISWKAS